MAWNPGKPGSDRHVSLIDAESEVSWQDGARCAEIGEDLWFPEGGGNVAQAKRICAGCEARVQCLEFALGNVERFGVWGGKTSPQRKRLLAEREPGVPRCPSGGCRACGEVRSERDRQTRQERRELAA
jgi:hypothetical protein